MEIRDVRYTFQGKGGIVINPMGKGIFNRPSLTSALRNSIFKPEQRIWKPICGNPWINTTIWKCRTAYSSTYRFGDRSMVLMFYCGLVSQGKQIYQPYNHMIYIRVISRQTRYASLCLSHNSCIIHRTSMKTRGVQPQITNTSTRIRSSQ